MRAAALTFPAVASRSFTKYWRSLDAVYGKSSTGVADATDQRILNWTAVNDEIHDFESNTRGVSGGLGAIVGDSTITSQEERVDISATGTNDTGVIGSVAQLISNKTTPRPLTTGTPPTSAGTAVIKAAADNWTFIDKYVQTIRSLKHASSIDPTSTSVQNGRALFASHNCANCHGGAKWTISRRDIPLAQGAATGSTTCALETNSTWSKKSVPAAQNKDTFQLQTEKTTTSCNSDTDCAAIAGAKCVVGKCSLLPARLTCSLREVGSYGATGGANEIRSDTDAVNGTPLKAQGINGFNPPSLLSLPSTAPYMHGGAAQTLGDLLTSAEFTAHTTAGDTNFVPTSTEAQDLASFLLSIDQTTETFAINASFDLCVGAFTTNGSAVCNNP